MSIRLPRLVTLQSVKIQFASTASCYLDHYYFRGDVAQPREIDVFGGTAPGNEKPGLLGDKPVSHQKVTGALFSAGVTAGIATMGNSHFAAIFSSDGSRLLGGFTHSDIDLRCMRSMHKKYEYEGLALSFSLSITSIIGDDGEPVVSVDGDAEYRRYNRIYRADITYVATRYGGNNLQVVLKSDDGQKVSYWLSVDIIYNSANAEHRGYEIALGRWALSRAYLDFVIYMALRADQSRPGAVVNALEHCQELTINSLAYIHDACRLKGDSLKLLEALKDIRNPKSWANLWLSYRYGLRLFIEDTAAIMRTAQRLYTQDDKHAIKTVYGSDRKLSEGAIFPNAVIREESHVKLYLDNRPSARRKLIRDIRRFDLAPSLENIWDFIPYSFVVDWVVPIGDICKRLDAAVSTTVFPIIGALTSCKVSYTLEELPKPLHGHITIVRYNRGFSPVSQLAQYARSLAGLEIGGGICNIKHGIDTVCMAYQRTNR